MGAPKFLSRFRELMETKIGITIDMGSTEIGEVTKSRGHKDPSSTRVYNVLLAPELPHPKAGSRWLRHLRDRGEILLTKFPKFLD